MRALGILLAVRGRGEKAREHLQRADDLGIEAADYLDANGIVPRPGRANLLGIKQPPP